MNVSFLILRFLYSFFLLLRQNPTTLQELFINNTDILAASNFDSSKPTKVFAHGWRMNGYDNEAVLNIRDGRISILYLNLISLLNISLVCSY